MPCFNSLTLGVNLQQTTLKPVPKKHQGNKLKYSMVIMQEFPLRKQVAERFHKYSLAPHRSCSSILDLYRPQLFTKHKHTKHDPKISTVAVFVSSSLRSLTN